MATFQLGSSGEPVRQIQQGLQSRGLYQGPVDGAYGGATQAAVRIFQKGAGLDADGIVGPASWQALLRDASPAAAPLASQGLDYRCLALTGTFETGKGVPECFSGITGDFDGQGISYGALQWNFGTGSLQPLLRDMVQTHEAIARNIFGPHFDALAAALALGDGAQARADLLVFARSIQHPVKYQVFEPWRGYAKALGRTPEFQAIQVQHAHQAYERALGLCEDDGLWSERGAALMFDIVTQNGSIGPVTRAQIVADVNALPDSLGADEREVQVLRLVANHRAQASNVRWIDDVRRRKSCIANGGGIVHGIHYNLASQFQIRLAAREAAA